MKKPSNSASSSPDKAQSNGAPRWETWTMALSFVALWAWFLAHQSAARAGAPLSLAWQIPLFVSLALLIWIFVRRARRALNGIRAINPTRRGRAGRD